MNDSSQNFIPINLFGICVSSSQLHSRHTGIKNDHLVGLNELNMELIVYSSYKSNLLQFIVPYKFAVGEYLGNIKHSVHIRSLLKKCQCNSMPLVRCGLTIFLVKCT